MAASRKRQPVGLAGLAAVPGLQPAQRAFVKQRLISQQNLALAVVGGGLAAALGAAGWALITVVSGYELGIVAIAVGALVGLAVRRMGRGVTPVFAAVGGVLALFACGAGNLLAAAALVARHGGVPLSAVLARLDLPTSRHLMVAFSTPMDVLFYAIAVMVGFRSSVRPVDAGEVRALLSGPSAPTA
jgi:hypothetical protein